MSSRLTICILCFLLGMGGTAVIQIAGASSSRNHVASKNLLSPLRKAPKWVRIYKTDFINDKFFLSPKADKDTLWTDELQRILSLPASCEQNCKLYILFADWAEADIEGALAAFNQIEGNEFIANLRDHDYYGTHPILYHWAGSDPEGFVYYLEKNPEKKYSVFRDFVESPSVYAHYIGRAASALASQSPKKAWEWASTFKDESRLRAMDAVLAGIVESHPELLENYARLVPIINFPKYTENDNEASFYGTLTANCKDLLLKQDKNLAVKWMRDRGSSEEGITSTLNLFELQELVKTDLSAAKKHLDIIDKSYERYCIKEIADSIPDFPDKLDFLLSKNMGVYTPLSRWLKTNEEEALKWIWNLPKGDVRDLCISDYIRSSQFPSLPDALNHAAFIESGKIRHDILVSSVKNWLSADPKAAAKWFSQYTGNESDKQILTPLFAPSPQSAVIHE